MAKYARIDGGVVAEIISDNPSGKYHPGIVWVQCTNDVQIGWVYFSGSFAVPVIPIDEARRIMRDAIKGKEIQKSSRKIEHPSIAGPFFDVSDKINKILTRSDALSNTDPLPTNGGCFDDVNEVSVPMTVVQLKRLRNAIIDREEANYINRKNHIKAMMLSADPLNYDYSGGWE
jgi:hypothetical protein